MVLSADRKSLNKSVDGLMPYTVAGPRRRSSTQDEMQRIAAYNAEVPACFSPPPFTLRVRASRPVRQGAASSLWCEHA